METIRFYQRKGLLREPDKPTALHPPLWGGGRGSGEIREIGTAAGVQSGRFAELLRLDDGTHCEEASSRPNTSSGRARLADFRRAWKPCCLNSWCACHARNGGKCFLPVDRVTKGEAGPARSAMP